MELMSMNKTNLLNDFAEKCIDNLENGSRAVIYAFCKTGENLCAKGVKHCKEDADKKRKASVIKQ